jgi:hypothetical protein
VKTLSSLGQLGVEIQDTDEMRWTEHNHTKRGTKGEVQTNGKSKKQRKMVQVNKCVSNYNSHQFSCFHKTKAKSCYLVFIEAKESRIKGDRKSENSNTILKFKMLIHFGLSSYRLRARTRYQQLFL